MLFNCSQSRVFLAKIDKSCRFHSLSCLKPSLLGGLKLVSSLLRNISPALVLGTYPFLAHQAVFPNPKAKTSLVHCAYSGIQPSSILPLALCSFKLCTRWMAARLSLLHGTIPMHWKQVQSGRGQVPDVSQPQFIFEWKGSDISTCLSYHPRLINFTLYTGHLLYICV